MSDHKLRIKQVSNPIFGTYYTCYNPYGIIKAGQLVLSHSFSGPTPYKAYIGYHQPIAYNSGSFNLVGAL
jgi:hypothetical protein